MRNEKARELCYSENGRCKESGRIMFEKGLRYNEIKKALEHKEVQTKGGNP